MTDDLKLCAFMTNCRTSAIFAMSADALVYDGEKLRGMPNRINYGIHFEHSPQISPFGPYLIIGPAKKPRAEPDPEPTLDDTLAAIANLDAPQRARLMLELAQMNAAECATDS